MKKIVISIGDPNGVGPEIILKFHKKYPKIKMVVFGDKTTLDFWSKFYEIKYSFDFRDINFKYIPEIGKETQQAGKVAFETIKQAFLFAKKEKLSIVTLPVSKTSIGLSQKKFSGHTEMLAELDNKSIDDVVMILGGEKMRVATLTRHIPLKAVADSLTQELIKKQIKILDKWFFSWKKRKPEIWISGINPHAGESGNIGNEEIETIIPAIKSLNEQNINIKGPFSADTMFFFGLKNNIDILCSCFHDQGLAPLKLIHFDDGVNVTAGLSITRTSVDHGTAFDISGKNKANIESFAQAIKWANEMQN
jgi:4-hydroxythreonine-4-phosphate dehydrogenase